MLPANSVLQLIQNPTHVGVSAINLFLPSLAACAEGEFACDVNRCYPIRFRCDGEQLCDDNTDEMNCPTSAPPTVLPPIGECLIPAFFNRHEYKPSIS